MSAECVHDDGKGYRTSHLYEEDLAQQWWELPSGQRLILVGGGACELVYAGRRGGSSGPDVRDAVLRFILSENVSADNELRFGDVEFHLRGSDWYAHAHERDSCYNNVILHVVLLCDLAEPIRCQNGSSIPTCTLYDLKTEFPIAKSIPLAVQLWPCELVMPQLMDSERVTLLHRAGLLRFEQKAQHYVEALRDAEPTQGWSAYDICLVPALAEAMGYGRNRAFFRTAGLTLMGLPSRIEEPLGHTLEPPRLDTQRLHMLRMLIESWQDSGLWCQIRGAVYNAGEQAYQPLRAFFTEKSVTRADIIICNVVLPFAYAVGLIEQDPVLFQKAQDIFVTYPMLQSNQITRAMCRQLLLEHEPQSACQQQGLQYIYQETCHEKRCGQCIAGKQDI